MRAVWKGTIGFGTYAIPVKAYSATEEHNIPLHQVHEADGGRVRVKWVCEVDGAEVPTAEIAKGYPVPNGDVVLLTAGDFASLLAPTTQSMDVVGFTPADQVDPMYFARSYYLEPEPVGTKPYVLLSEALQQSGRIAIVKVTLRQRETLGALRVRDQVILLETMLWPDEIRRPDFPFLHEDVDLRRGELRNAVSLIEDLTQDFEPGRYTDHYRETLEALIQAKLDGDDVLQPTAAEQAEGVTRLLAALQQGPVEKAKEAADKARQARTRAKRASSSASSAKTG
ncbi:Ku protein [Amycolatopsis keratiniphila]|uniref:non-homologous end joining protein Ku n=1 Tax=Amycolatopsis keratiniphila TaxID=129921 RepID=UPI00087DBABE|nr:Ku protein [Amycolatopsis keratiniphila]OLZ44004.1 Ku protein [Amycolatopsis keratiniphila subsp. nogabecina]SDU70826.1 DNA end-binding protein Ku [Amycolatopsis keratiniphila]